VSLVTPHNGIDPKYCLHVDEIQYSPYSLLTVIGRKFKTDGYGTLVRSLFAVNVPRSSFPGFLPLQIQTGIITIMFSNHNGLIIVIDPIGKKIKKEESV
jgi:hypothetical protein